MTEELFLKCLWFAAGFISSVATYFGQSPTRYYGDRAANASIPLIIFTVIYVIARAMVVAGGGPK
jgi:hypothetical protein